MVFKFSSKQLFGGLLLLFTAQVRATPSQSTFNCELDQHSDLEKGLIDVLNTHMCSKNCPCP